jgi:hypothetical protein
LGKNHFPFKQLKLTDFFEISLNFFIKKQQNRKCELDMEDSSDNVINYKKLVKEQTGISVKERMKTKEKQEKEQQAEKEGGGGDVQLSKTNNDKMLETNGGGGHMAAVIRRIEALYQGGVQGGDESDSSSEESSDEEESEEEEMSEDGEEEEDGEKGEGEEDGSEEEDDDEDDDSSGSEMEDDHPTRTPGGTLVAPPSKEKRAKREKGSTGGDEENANNDDKSAPGSDEKQPQNDQEKKKKRKKKEKSNKRRRRGDIDWYDVDDDWIDDEELDEYFDRDGRKTKHSGFFVNKGEIQNVNADGTTPLKGEVELTYKQKEQLRLEAEARGEIRCGRGWTINWTEPMLTALKEGVEEFGHAWAHIVSIASTNEKYAPLVGLSKDQMTRKWMNMREEMIANGIEPPAAFVSAMGTKVSNPLIGRRPQPIGEWKPEDENDPELVEIVKALAKLAQIFSGKINDDANEFGLGQHALRADKQEKLNSKLEEFCMRAPKELFNPFLSRAMVMYLLTEMEFVWTEKTLRDKMNKFFKTANPDWESAKLVAEGGEGGEGGENGIDNAAGFSSPNTRSVRPTPTKSARPTPLKAASKSPAVAATFDEKNDDWMTDTWKSNFEDFKKRCEICHAKIQKSKKPNEWVFDPESTEAFLRLVKTQFEHPGTGPGKGKFSSVVYAAAVKAIPEMYNLHVANMRNKYSNERQKLARMYV